MICIGYQLSYLAPLISLLLISLTPTIPNPSQSSDPIGLHLFQYKLICFPGPQNTHFSSDHTKARHLILSGSISLSITNQGELARAKTRAISCYFPPSMASASAASALANGLTSTFLSGGSKRNAQALLAGSNKLAGSNPAGKRLVVVAAAAPKKSWIPGVRFGGNLVDPEWLDGSLPGDFGFDPLGLGKDPAFLKWYREAELIHGRWAMAAVLGIFVGQAWSGVPWFEAGAQPGAVAPFSFGTLLGTQLLLMGWVESKRWVDFFNPDSQSVEWATPWSRTAGNFANATGEQGYPGGKFFDPLGLAGATVNGEYVPDTEKLERLKLAEIKHARIAMLAMLIFYFEAGQGKTPLGALGL